MDEAHGHELLVRERARVERALGRVSGDLQSEEEAVQEEQVDDQPNLMVDEELDMSVRQTLEDQLAAIERAEKRLAEGKYGISVESGEPIPDARLEIVPWAERTAEEQSRWERGL